MATTLTAQAAKVSLQTHVAAKGAELFSRYGPHIGYPALAAILQDRAFVRYPCELVFDAGPLQPGEFAYPAPNGDRPEDGYTLHVHPIYLTRLTLVPHLVFYQLVAVNYGEFASPDDAETFAAAALGLDREDYYRTLCELADLLGASFDPGSGLGGGLAVAAGCGGGGCGCGG